MVAHKKRSDKLEHIESGKVQNPIYCAMVPYLDRHGIIIKMKAVFVKSYFSQKN